jgi:signal transduction histidine kinase
MQGQIFGMFQRVNRHYEGTGIGLALVRKVAERMGGHVGVESQPNQGSRFWLDLKLCGQND